MPDGQYTVLAAILAGVIVRAWFAWDKRRASDRSARPGPATWQDTPAQTGWRYAWWSWSILLLAGYTIVYAIAYELGAW